jgi:NTE family protein
MRSAEMTRLMRDLDYRKFCDHPVSHHLGRVDVARSLLFDQGMYRGDYVRSWLDEILSQYGVRTFGDLHDPEAESDPQREKQYRLVVMASDISQGCLRRLPWDYGRYDIEADTVPVVDAVRASMSIPFFYEPVKLRDGAGRDSWLVDGALLSNFPIDAFDRKDQEQPRWPTIGIKLSARPEARQDAANEVRGPLTMAKAMLETMVSFHDHLHLEDPSVQDRTIFVDTTGFRTLDFDIDSATMQKLYDSGRRAAEKFVDGGRGRLAWDFETYKARHREHHPPHPGRSVVAHDRG